MPKLKSESYDGSRKPSLNMVETIVKASIAINQIRKIELRAQWILKKHAELKEASSKSDKPSEKKANQKLDEALLAELEVLKEAKKLTVNRKDELEAKAPDQAEYEYPELDW